ncbi:hypothetical protein [Sphingomonas sp. CROZ-RG-20F-R02-07]|uniref:hypothetical protein n=1 Tax=Sphingomonas sp. CROZ-RG-20F-R02-07 TaxID=2914832 RepID=UPI001F55B56E|nr:hypothetical protein [Sphingomonas sp. CROZ-RG-20F-R02-07]
MGLKTPLVMGADGLPQQLQAGDTITAAASTYTSRVVTNGEGSAAVVIGAPVYASAADTVKRAQANAKATCRVAGLGLDPSIAASAAGNMITGGVLVATTAQWDAVAGTTGGLTFGTYYFVDPANPGKLTATPPTTVGQVVTMIGLAISATELELDIQPPILL